MPRAQGREHARGTHIELMNALVVNAGVDDVLLNMQGTGRSGQRTLPRMSITSGDTTPDIVVQKSSSDTAAVQKQVRQSAVQKAIR